MDSNMKESPLTRLDVRKWNRRDWLKFLGAGGVSAALTSWYMKFFEPGNVEVTTKNIAHCLRADVPSGIRIVHMSDFHASVEVPLDYIERCIDMAVELNPDVIFLTGDFVTWEIDDPDHYSRILKKLSGVAPVFACPGNHDGGYWATKHGGYPSISPIQTFLDSCNVRMLINEKVEWSCQGMTFDIIGMGDLWAKQILAPGLLPSIRHGRMENVEKPILLLAHNPDSKIALWDYDWDIMFSGHTHGGQLVIPFFNQRPFLPVYDKKHPEGLRQWENHRFVQITRGIGNRHGLRFNCRPEISILTT